ncbi:MAG: hypothetical protein GC160_02990 [Acidobacteria bacterium]|nr:hypothetical protein [Acidobacteriota bacterium]
MSTADTFPIEMEFSSSLTQGAGVATFRCVGGEEISRIVEPFARIFSGTAAQRPKADAMAVLEFYQRMGEEFFSFEDPLTGRTWSAVWASPPRIGFVGYERYDIEVQLREAAGKPLASYPTTPLLERPLDPVDVGDGLLFFYSGYGYKLTATGVSTAELDGASSSTSSNYSVPLGAHCLKVLPNSASVTKLEVVH